MLFPEHKTAIDQTGIPHHLDQMIIILLEEEELSETGSTASSMEYLLQHKILETLYTLARTDVRGVRDRHLAYPYILYYVICKESLI